jgi:hypothetical protein
VKASRSEIPTPKTINPNWIAGFSSGDGCLLVKIEKSYSHKLGARVQLRFTITQHSPPPSTPPSLSLEGDWGEGEGSIDAELLKRLVNSLGCVNITFVRGKMLVIFS